MYYSLPITCVRRTSLYHYIMITYATWINAPSATLSDKAAMGNRNLGICPNIFRLLFCIVNFCILVSSRRGEVVSTTQLGAGRAPPPPAPPPNASWRGSGDETRGEGVRGGVPTRGRSRGYAHVSCTREYCCLHYLHFLPLSNTGTVKG